mmetsp:Transcript_40398/g.133137  ORF Transcript_40398/g.133137 Transcript_40398/m.133137 type:complete len:329 (+) Transcript_40398:591-1577(+)
MRCSCSEGRLARLGAGRIPRHTPFEARSAQRWQRLTALADASISRAEASRQRPWPVGGACHTPDSSAAAKRLKLETVRSTTSSKAAPAGASAATERWDRAAISPRRRSTGDGSPAVAATVPLSTVDWHVSRSACAVTATPTNCVNAAASSGVSGASSAVSTTRTWCKSHCISPAPAATTCSSSLKPKSSACSSLRRPPPPARLSTSCVASAPNSSHFGPGSPSSFGSSWYSRIRVDWSSAGQSSKPLTGESSRASLRPVSSQSASPLATAAASEATATVDADHAIARHARTKSGSVAGKGLPDERHSETSRSPTSTSPARCTLRRNSS